MYRIIPGKTLPIEFKIEVKSTQEYDFIIQYLENIGYSKDFPRSIGFLRYFVVTEYKSIEKFESRDHFKHTLVPEIKFEDYFELMQDSTEPTQITCKLKELLENMTQEEFDKAWEEIKNLKLKGPTIEEYLKSK